MSPLRLFVCVFLFLTLCAGAFSPQLFASGAPQVFVSTGIAGKIYSVNTSTGAYTALVSMSGADYEGMVVAPDNTLQYPYLVYACDPQHGTIIRFDPAAATVQTIYSGALSPQCGRITSTGDLVVTSTGVNAGLWKFAGVTDIALGSTVPGPTALASTPGSTDAGIAQKNNGDLLVVDRQNGQVLRSSAPSFASAPSLISGLSSPFGIARRSDGGIFVSNQGGTPNITQFDAQGQSPTTCEAFRGGNKGVPALMQVSLDDVLYVVGANNNKGFLQSLSAVGCTGVTTFSLPAPAVGIALPPTSVSHNAVATNGSDLIKFGFAAFEINNIKTDCGGQVVVNLMSPAAIQGLIANAGVATDDAFPAVNLGLDGFETVFNTDALNGCTAGDKTTLNFQIASVVDDSIVRNPEIVVCTTTDGDTDCRPASTNLSQVGVWPINTDVPQDGLTGGSKSVRCNIFMASSHPTGAPGQEDGTFCGFQSPIANTFDPAAFAKGSPMPWDLTPSSFSAGKSVPVKFKLSPGKNSNCQSAPYITDATAILSVAQIAPNFVPIGLVSNGSSGLGQPLFKGDGNNQYLFNWDTSSCIQPSGQIGVCPKGTYSLSVTFLSDNTANSMVTPPQSIYTSQTTTVVLK